MELAIQNALSFFINVLIEIIPLFLAVTFLAGLALEYIKPQMIREKLGGKKGITGILAATALGFVTPFCSCSTIPLLAGMMAAGIPIGILTAFLFASPYPVEVGMIVLGPVFGWTFAVAFIATGAIIAVVGGLLLQRFNWQNQIKDDFIKGLEPKNKIEETESACDCGENSGNDADPIGCGCSDVEKNEPSIKKTSACDCMGNGGDKPEPSGCGCGVVENHESSIKETSEDGNRVDEIHPACGCGVAEQHIAEEETCGCGASPEATTNPSGQTQTHIRDGFPQKAKRAALYSLGFFKRMFLFILAGSIMGSIIYGFVPEDLLATYMGGTSILAVPIAALIGVPLYVSIIPVIPIILSLSGKGVSTGAVIAFMITATSISPPELIMLSGMFKKQYIALFVTMMIIGAIATGYVFNIIAL
jgi:uncharacterized membrane protein YraQ (UPF0718 family)